jgi:hypothetical protein
MNILIIQAGAETIASASLGFAAAKSAARKSVVDSQEDGNSSYVSPITLTEGVKRFLYNNKSPYRISLSTGDREGSRFNAHMSYTDAVRALIVGICPTVSEPALRYLSLYFSTIAEGVLGLETGSWANDSFVNKAKGWFGFRVRATGPNRVKLMSKGGSDIASVRAMFGHFSSIRDMVALDLHAYGELQSLKLRYSSDSKWIQLVFSDPKAHDPHTIEVATYMKLAYLLTPVGADSASRRAELSQSIARVSASIANGDPSPSLKMLNSNLIQQISMYQCGTLKPGPNCMAVSRTTAYIKRMSGIDITT